MQKLSGCLFNREKNAKKEKTLTGLLWKNLARNCLYGTSINDVGRNLVMFDHPPPVIALGETIL